MDAEQARHWIGRARETDVKAALRESTDRALEDGVFGVPSMVVGDQVLWGHDQFPALAAILRGEDPAASLTDAVMDELQATARRRPHLSPEGDG